MLIEGLQREGQMKYFLMASIFLSTSMAPVPGEFVERHLCRATEKVSCIVDTALVCPPGYYDGCLSGETKTHQCVMSDNGPSCELEMSLNCPENFEDGCLSDQTQIHTCVPTSGDLCSRELNFSCPSGFEDSCG